MDAEQYQKEEKEFRCVVLKALRTLARSMVLYNPLFWKRESDVWDWQKEMQEMEEELHRVESGLKE